MPLPRLTALQGRVVAFPKHRTKAFLEGTRELQKLMTTETIEGEVTREIVVQPSQALFAGETPSDVVARMKDTATALKEIIETAHGSDGKPLVMKIPGLNGAYVRCEGWTTLGAMLSVFPVNVWTRELPDGKGYEARVEARTLTGAIVGAAEAMCSKDEQRWHTADKYALRSMAQTRATSKALRMPLGFVMTLAGYEATPAEEMQGVSGDAAPSRAPKCPVHGPMRFVKAGVGKKSGKPYDAFWGCSNKECGETVKNVDWQAYLTQKDAEQTPREEYDPNDLPDEVSESETAPVAAVVVGDSKMSQKKAIRGLLAKVDAMPIRKRETFYAGLLQKYPKCRGTDGNVHLTPLDQAEADDIIATAGAYTREDA